MSFELWIMFHDGMPLIHKGCIYCHSTKYSPTESATKVNKHNRRHIYLVQNWFGCDLYGFLIYIPVILKTIRFYNYSVILC